MRCLTLIGVVLSLLAMTADAAGLRFSLVRTGQTLTSSDYAWRDDGWVLPQPVNHLAVLIEHGGQRLLFGTGLGRNIDAQLDAAVPWRSKRYSSVQPARDQLDRDGIRVDRIVLGCARWSHSSGLADFATLPVLASPEGVAYARTGTAPAVLASQFAHGVDWQPLRFEQQRYAAFEESLDLFGDGRLVLVKLPRHGVLGLFLTLDDGRRFFIRGDWESLYSDEITLPGDVRPISDVSDQKGLGFYPQWVE